MLCSLTHDSYVGMDGDASESRAQCRKGDGGHIYQEDDTRHKGKIILKTGCFV